LIETRSRELTKRFERAPRVRCQGLGDNLAGVFRHWWLHAPIPNSQAPSRFARRSEFQSLQPQAAPRPPRGMQVTRAFVPIAPSGPSPHDPSRYSHAEKNGCGIDRSNHEGHPAETTIEATLIRCLLIFVG
jgi:hypothetical protein